MSGAYDGLRLAARESEKGKDEPENELDPATPGEEEPNSSEQEKEKMTDEKKVEDAPKGAAAIDFNARMQTVFASDAAKGREARAAQILGDPDFNGLTAEAVIKILATEAKPEANADDAEDGREMLNLLRDGANADLGSGPGDKPKAENHGWGKAFAKVAALYGLKN